MKTRQTANTTITKPRKNKLHEFACMALYYVISATVLNTFISLYLHATLLHSSVLDNPLVFALGILGCGIASWVVYQGLNIFLNLTLKIFVKMHSGSLYILRSAETTLIAILICITFGGIIYFTQSANPHAKLVYQMLFSLPIGKLTFLDSSPCKVLSDIQELIAESRGAWLFCTYMIIESGILLLPKVPALLCNIILILVALTLIVRSILSNGST